MGKGRLTLSLTLTLRRSLTLCLTRSLSLTCCLRASSSSESPDSSTFMATKASALDFFLSLRFFPRGDRSAAATCPFSDHAASLVVAKLQVGVSQAVPRPFPCRLAIPPAPAASPCRRVPDHVGMAAIEWGIAVLKAVAPF